MALPLSTREEPFSAGAEQRIHRVLAPAIAVGHRAPFASSIPAIARRSVSAVVGPDAGAHATTPASHAASAVRVTLAPGALMRSHTRDTQCASPALGRIRTSITSSSSTHRYRSVPRARVKSAAPDHGQPRGRREGADIARPARHATNVDAAFDERETACPAGRSTKRRSGSQGCTSSPRRLSRPWGPTRTTSALHAVSPTRTAVVGSTPRSRASAAVAGQVRLTIRIAAAAGPRRPARRRRLRFVVGSRARTAGEQDGRCDRAQRGDQAKPHASWSPSVVDAGRRGDRRAVRLSSPGRCLFSVPSARFPFARAHSAGAVMGDRGARLLFALPPLPPPVGNACRVGRVYVRDERQGASRRSGPRRARQACGEQRLSGFGRATVLGAAAAGGVLEHREHRRRARLDVKPRLPERQTPRTRPAPRACRHRWHQTPPSPTPPARAFVPTARTARRAAAR